MNEERKRRGRREIGRRNIWKRREEYSIRYNNIR